MWIEGFKTFCIAFLSFTLVLSNAIWYIKYLGRKHRDEIKFALSVMKEDEAEKFRLEKLREARLSPREMEVLSLLDNAGGRKAIAEQLFVSKPTVDATLKHIYRKLEIGTIKEAVQFINSAKMLRRK